MKILDGKDKAQIRAYLEQGWTCERIAEEMNCAVCTIRRHSISMNKEQPIELKLSEEKLNQVIEYYRSGLRIAEIEEKTFVSQKDQVKLYRKLISEGRIEKRKSDLGKNVVTKPTQPHKDPLEGVGVKCTEAVAKTCVYGARDIHSPNRCDYLFYTGKCRTVENGCSGKCPPNHCTEYKKRESDKGKK